MAEERARILGRRRALPTALERAAVQWEKEREAKAKEAQTERATLSRAPAETPPFSLQQVLPRANGIETDEEVGWKSYKPPHQGKVRGRRLGGIAVGSFATRLIQRERSGGGRVVTDPRARALEEAAQRWEEQRKASNPRR